MASTARTRPVADPTTGPSAYVAEFVGTLLLVFAIGAAASANSKGGLGFTDFVTIALVHAFALTILVASFGRFSGGHFNPAVTISLLAIKKVKAADAIVYIIVQLLGATAAAGLLALAFTKDIGTIANFGAAAPVDELVSGKNGIGGGFIFEALGVFALVSVIVATAVAPGGDRRFAPLAIGLGLGLANFVAAPFTGGALNPARAFGPALVGNSFGPVEVFLVVYVLAPIVGGVIAAVLYNGLLGPDRAREVKPEATLSSEA
ncbi:MAG: aquaporin [Patulibacter minatonensis]